MNERPTSEGIWALGSYLCLIDVLFEKDGEIFFGACVPNNCFFSEAVWRVNKYKENNINELGHTEENSFKKSFVLRLYTNYSVTL